MNKQSSDELLRLIEDCKKGQRRAMHRLFRTYYGLLFTVCMRYAHCYEDAQDMVNEGFMKIFAGLSAYQPSGSFEAWMKTIMVNTALDYLRKYRRTAETVSYDDVTEDVLQNHDDNEAIAKMSTDELMMLIQQLPLVSRTVFNLYVFEDMPHKEIAKKLNIKEGTSHWHLNFARTKLKEAIENIHR